MLRSIEIGRQPTTTTSGKDTSAIRGAVSGYNAACAGCLPPLTSPLATPALNGNKLLAATGKNRLTPAKVRRRLASRQYDDANQNDADTGEPLNRQPLAEQIPGGEGVDDVPEREHRIGDRHIHSRQSDHPHRD